MFSDVVDAVGPCLVLFVGLKHTFPQLQGVLTADFWLSPPLPLLSSEEGHFNQGHSLPLGI